MANGQSYKDPLYASLEAKYEKKHGVQAGLTARIRTLGEKSNANEVSPVGARTVYQIMPATRRLFQKKYKVDAYQGPEQAAEIAVLHLKESFDRTGSWDTAVREYHGGPDPKQWGKVNRAYAARVSGNKGAFVARAKASTILQPLQGEVPEGPVLADLSVDDILTLNPADLGNSRANVGPIRPLGPLPKGPNKPTKSEKIAGNLAGIPQVGLNRTADRTGEAAAQAEGEAAQVAGTQITRPVWGQPGKTVTTTIDKSDVWNAAVQQNWLLAELPRAFDRANPETDPKWAREFLNNWDELEKPATTPKEAAQLRDTSSREEYNIVLRQQAESRERNRVIQTASHPTLTGLGAALVDPAGFAVGFGVSKVAQVAGVGSSALWAAGRHLSAVGSIAAEGAAGNVLFTEMLDPNATANEIGMSALVGMAMGVAMTPLLAMGGKAGAADTHAAETVAALRATAQAEQTATVAAARTNLGPDAAPEAVKAEVQRLDAKQKTDWINQSLADVPDDLRLLAPKADDEVSVGLQKQLAALKGKKLKTPRGIAANDAKIVKLENEISVLVSKNGGLLTADPAVLRGVTERGNLAAISDAAERGVVAEHLARAEAILKANPIDEKSLKTVLKLAGMESTGLRLLASESPVARAVGSVLLEGTTGAAGRRRTAAMAQATRERLYNRHFMSFDSNYHQFRKGEGVGIMSEAYHGRIRKQFNDRVYAEVEARGGKDTGSFDANPAVIRAADEWEAGMNAMRLEQQRVMTVGSARLGETSRGYVQHQMDSRKIAALTPKQQARVREELSAQFVDPRNDFDKKFSDQLATKYLEKAMNRARGGFDVPMNLHSPEAADIVRDSLEAMNLKSTDIERLMGKFSRGGASHTKRRLRLEMTADIGDGMKMQDLFNTDMSALYRSYARRVSGEVALAQYGIMGKKGLNVLRTAIGSTKGSAKDLEAFDQIAAEFLNTPFGSHNHKNMDNIRVATSLSRLGGMGFTQFGEFANAMVAVGIHRTFNAIGAMPRLIKEVRALRKGGPVGNPILASIDTLGGHIGVDDYALTRLFDVKDNDIQMYGTDQIGVGTRALRAAGNMQAVLSGHRMITAVQTRGMAEQIIHKAIGFARSGRDDAALNDMGITEDLRALLRKDMDAIATFDGDRLTSLDLSKSTMTGNQMMTLRDAIERGSSQIIQRTYTGETGKWAHDGFLKLLTQFRTFSLTSVEKQWGRNQANYGALKSAMYLAGAMSFAVPIHLARTQLKLVGMTDKRAEETAAHSLTVAAMARATLNYASASGLIGDVLDVGGGFASSLGGDTGEELAMMMGGRGVGARGQGQGQLIGGVVAPGVGLLEDVWKGVHGDGRKLAKAMPGSNLPYVAPLINALETE